MRNLKKVLSLSLALVMLLGMMIVGAGAAANEFADVDSANKEEAINVMSAVGVFEGVGGNNFNPGGTLSRAEAAAILVRMSASDAVVTAVKNSGASASIFSDVPADKWYAPYVNYAATMGWIDGTGDGTFNPKGEVKGYEFGKMLLGVLGYTQDEGRYVGAMWKVNVLEDLITGMTTGAKGASMLTGLDGVDLNKALTREQACQMALNAAQRAVVTYSTDAKTLSAGQTPKSLIDTNTARFQGLTKATAGSTVDKFGHPTQEWKVGSTVVAASSIAEATMTVAGEDFAKTTTLDGYTFTGTKYYYNGVAREANEFDMDGARGATIEVYCTGTNVDRIVAIEAYLVEVATAAEEEGDDVVLTVREPGYMAGNAGSPATVTVKEGDKDYDLVKDMAAKDVFMGVFNTGNWAPSDSSARTPLLKVEAPETLEGKVTAAKIKMTEGGSPRPVYSQSSISIDGSEYKFSNEYGRAAVDLGSEGTFYLYNGYVVYFDGTVDSGEDDEILYAVVLQYGKKDGTGAAGGLDAQGTADEYQARLLFTDGHAEVVVISKFDGDTIVSGTAGANEIKYGTGSGELDVTANKNIFVSYVVNNGKYELDPVEDDSENDLAVVAKGSITGIKKGSVAFTMESASAGSLIGNNNTVFLTAVGTSEVEYAAVTGIANVSNYNAAGTGTAVTEFAALTVNGVATYVYVKADEADGAAPTTTTNYAYITGSATPTKGYAEDGETVIYTVDAIIDGEKATLSSKTEDHVKNKDGLVTYTTTDGYVSEAMTQKTGADLKTLVLVSGGVIVYDTNNTATFDENTVIYQISATGVKMLTAEELEKVKVDDFTVVVEETNETATLIWLVPNA